LTHKETVNLTSLNLIREELVATIEQAATHLESFVEDQENPKLLQSCIDSLQQISGSLDLIQLYGAQELAKEILDAANDITVGDQPPVEEGLSALTRSFFTLSRYFEYAFQSQKGMPVLMVPYINDIRAVGNKPLMPESYFFEIDLPDTFEPLSDKAIAEDSAAAIRRFRHMYQVGLLGLFKQTRVEPSFNMMQRALERVQQTCAGHHAEGFWAIAKGAITVFDSAELELTRERKRVLGQIDRQLKQLQNSGVDAFTQHPQILTKELIYHTALAGTENEQYQQLQQQFGFAPLSYTEVKRKQEQQALTGPSANTVSSVVGTLQEELKSVKEIIEVASQSDTSAINNHKELLAKTTKIKDILDIVGLTSAADTMKQQLTKMELWQQGAEEADTAELLEMADAFLYVESTLNGLDKLNFSDERLSELNQITRQEMIVASHLAQAQLVVLEEAESGLAMIKRALSSFSDSDYDRAHIRNVPATLSGVRGGMILLEESRAAAIVTSCVQFIEESLLPTNQPAALQHMLETFADALIGLEYYMDCLKIDANVDDDILTVAEESLSALGYGVSHTGT